MTVNKQAIFLALLFSCTLASRSVASSERFTAALPSEQWEWEKTPPAGVPAQIMHLYLKRKGSGSQILLRAARKGDFGVPTYFEPEDDEFAYLVKLIHKGSYLGEITLSLTNPALAQSRAFNFSVQQPPLGEMLDLVVMQKGKDMIIIELITTPKDYDKDLGDLKKFLSGLQDKGAK